ncbi:glycosyltransferase family 2 protein [Roseovarius sp. S4756]|uniref:glycosyltransferase family 2 protein n=1 Tax=Roseovarius maritimus TaxID=3342637 RepID=UPI003727A65A
MTLAGTQSPPASFIMLTFNQQDSVAKAVQSVLDQQCEPIEIIISDDCSTDRSFEIIQDVVERYEGPHHVIARRNDVNLGVNAHIECAIGLSTADLMIWTAGDDINTENRAARILETVRERPAKLLFSDARTKSADGGDGRDAYRRALFYRDYSMVDAALSFELYLGATVAWHKDLYLKYGGFPTDTAYEDLILGFRAVLEDSIDYIAEPLVIYQEGVGVSNLLSRQTSKLPNSERRIAVLTLQLNVLKQRLADTRTFGLLQRHPVVTALCRRIETVESRLLYYQWDWASVWAKCGRPIRFSHALLSEMVRDLRQR